MLDTLLKKCATFIDDDVRPIGSEPLSLETMKAYFKTYSIKELLGYESYLGGIYLNQTTAGFVLESMPLVGFTTESHQTISNLFKSLLPERSNIQFLLMADPFIGNVLDYWHTPRQNQGAMMEKLGASRVAYMKRLANTEIKDLSARTFRVLISVTRPLSDKVPFDTLFAELTELKERLITIFSMAHMHIFDVVPETLLSLIDDFFGCGIKEQDFRSSTIDYSPFDFIRDQAPLKNTVLEVLPKGLRLNSGERMFSAYRVKKYPAGKGNSTVWTQCDMGDLIGNGLEPNRLACCC